MFVAFLYFSMNSHFILIAHKDKYLLAIYNTEKK